MQDRVQSCPCRIQLCGSRGVIHSEPLFPQLYVGLKRAAREELTQRGMAWIQAWGWVLGNQHHYCLKDLHLDTTAAGPPSPRPSQDRETGPWGAQGPSGGSSWGH